MIQYGFGFKVILGAKEKFIGCRLHSEIRISYRLNWNRLEEIGMECQDWNLTIIFNTNMQKVKNNIKNEIYLDWVNQLSDVEKQEEKIDREDLISLLNLCRWRCTGVYLFLVNFYYPHAQV